VVTFPADLAQLWGDVLGVWRVCPTT